MLKKVRVVLVHGIFDKGRSMIRLAGALEAVGCRCDMPDLVPNDGTVGLEELSKQLATFVDEKLKVGEVFVLVGFSMGALVARIYLQGHARFRRVVAFYSISGPHGGSWTAWLGRGKGAKELRPGSSLLKRLAVGSDDMAKIPVVCYWTPFDLMVFPPGRARWSLADKNVIILVPAHPLMLRSRKLSRDLVSRIGDFGS